MHVYLCVHVDSCFGHREHPSRDGVLMLHGLHHGWVCPIFYSLPPWLYRSKYFEELSYYDFWFHVSLLLHYQVIQHYFLFNVELLIVLRPGASSIDTVISFIAFLVLEVAIGMYFPAISYLRGVVIPESNRANVMNWFRYSTS